MKRRNEKEKEAHPGDRTACKQNQINKQNQYFILFYSG